MSSEPVRRRSRHAALAAHGEPWVWLTGGALALDCLPAGAQHEKTDQSNKSSLAIDHDLNRSRLQRALLQQFLLVVRSVNGRLYQ